MTQGFLCRGEGVGGGRGSLATRGPAEAARREAEKLAALAALHSYTPSHKSEENYNNLNATRTPTSVKSLQETQVEGGGGGGGRVCDLPANI